jgi:spermidine/putrescine transport system substrate-binding protein
MEDFMKRHLSLLALGTSLLMGAGTASAEGVLSIYNFGNYTSPELIKKFEAAYKVKVTITDFDSNDTAIAKVRAGGHGFDMVVASASFVPIYVQEGLLLESHPDQMENYKHLDPKWTNVPFDPGRTYSVPWQWGATGVTVNTKIYKGDINTSALFLDPPPELVGKLNIIPEMTDVMMLAVLYFGGEFCSADKDMLKKVRDKLKEAKPKWISIDYGTPEAYAKGDYAAGVNWNGYSSRARIINPDIAFGFPKEGYPLWMDNLAVLKDAKNVENAKLFQNFVMAPENAALISNFARYRDGSIGSEAFYDDTLKSSPEINMSAETLARGHFQQTCAPDVQALYTAIWTDVLK